MGRKLVHYYISYSEDCSIFGDIIVTEGVLEKEEKRDGTWIKMDQKDFESLISEKIDLEESIGWKKQNKEDYDLVVDNQLTYYENCHDDDHMIGCFIDTIR